MEVLISKIEEILEVEGLDISKKFIDYDEWDSLCSLSILAMLDSDYHITMTSKEVVTFSSIEDFCREVLSRK